MDFKLDLKMDFEGDTEALKEIKQLCHLCEVTEEEMDEMDGADYFKLQEVYNSFLV